jgi:hypothetical protein
VTGGERPAVGWVGAQVLERWLAGIAAPFNAAVELHEVPDDPGKYELRCVAADGRPLGGPPLPIYPGTGL